MYPSVPSALLRRWPLRAAGILSASIPACSSPKGRCAAKAHIEHTSQIRVPGSGCCTGMQGGCDIALSAGLWQPIDLAV